MPSLPHVPDCSGLSAGGGLKEIYYRRLSQEQRSDQVPAQLHGPENAGARNCQAFADSAAGRPRSIQGGGITGSGFGRTVGPLPHGKAVCPGIFFLLVHEIIWLAVPISY